jgi:hypothetical protein
VNRWDEFGDIEDLVDPNGSAMRSCRWASSWGSAKDLAILLGQSSQVRTELSRVDLDPRVSSSRCRRTRPICRRTARSDTCPLNSNPLGIGRHAGGIADPFDDRIDEFRISHVQRSDDWIATTWNWGFSTSQDFNGDIALIACFASSWTPAMVRRWHADPFGFLHPWGEAPALIASAPPATPPRPAPACSPS